MKKDVVYYDGNISILPEIIEEYPELKSKQLVCSCSYNDYLSVKIDKRIVKNKVFFVIEEHRSGLLKSVFSKLFFKVLWAYRNRKKSGKAYSKCKNVIVCFKESKVKLLNSIKIDDIYSQETQAILRLKPKMLLRRVELPFCGLYSDIMVWSTSLRFAYENDLDVYFDLEHYPNIYQEKHNENAWEYYYKQGAEKPKDKEMILVGDLINYPEDYKWKLEANYFLKLYDVYRYYLNLNKEMQDKLDREWNRIRAQIENEKIVGVKFRGTDYKKEYVPAGHGIQSTCEEMINIVARFMEQNGYKYIYLSVEEEESIKEFIDAFGKENVFVENSKYINEYSGQCATSILARNLYGAKAAGTLYVSQVEGLIRCDSLICNINSGAMVCIAYNGKNYEKLVLVDNGLTTEYGHHQIMVDKSNSFMEAKGIVL